MLELFDAYYLISATKLFFKIMFVCTCFFSIVLLVSPSTFGKIDKRLQKNYGIKKQLLPWLERERVMIDNFINKHYRIIASLAIVASLVLFFSLR